MSTPLPSRDGTGVSADPFGDGRPAVGIDTRASWRHFTPWGRCAACGHRRRRQAHHVILEQMVQRAGGNRWAVQNRILICDACHQAHHGGGDGRIPFERVPQTAVEFASHLLGAGAAIAYFQRRYR
jgi:hypothetical protein